MDKIPLNKWLERLSLPCNATKATSSNTHGFLFLTLAQSRGQRRFKCVDVELFYY